MFCSYYQAHVNKAECLFFVSILRSFDHLSFDRTLDAQQQIFEFFVPQDTEQQFVAIMKFFEEKGIIKNFTSLPNRLQDVGQKF